VIVDELDDQECLRLLATEPVGRLGLSAAALPVVLPVNFVLVGRRAVFASEPGLKVDAARDRVVACLEVDGFDRFAHDGWSVLATGHLAVVDDPGEVERARPLPLSPWALDGELTYVELAITLLSGRRVGRW